MSTALLPTLTAVDRRVLARLPGPDERGKRARDTFPAPKRMQPSKVAAAFDEHCEILRGLEHLGLAQRPGGWWRRA